LPAGEVLVSIVNYDDTNKLRVELQGRCGPVEMTPTSPRGFDRDSSNSKWSSNDIARGAVSAAGRHTLRVIGFETESGRPRTIIVGRGVTAMERLERIPGLGRLMRRG
jgi:hypothetical protein